MSLHGLGRIGMLRMSDTGNLTLGVLGFHSHIDDRGTCGVPERVRKEILVSHIVTCAVDVIQCGLQRKVVVYRGLVRCIRAHRILEHCTNRKETNVQEGQEDRCQCADAHHHTHLPWVVAIYVVAIRGPSALRLCDTWPNAAAVLKADTDRIDEKRHLRHHRQEMHERIRKLLIHVREHVIRESPKLEDAIRQLRLDWIDLDEKLVALLHPRHEPVNPRGDHKAAVALRVLEKGNLHRAQQMPPLEIREGAVISHILIDEHVVGEQVALQRAPVRLEFIAVVLQGWLRTKHNLVNVAHK